MKGFKIKDIVISEIKISLLLLDLRNTETMARYLSLFEMCFGKRSNIDESLFSWLNNDTPSYSNLNFAFIDDSTDEIIAAYGLQPGDARVNGSIEKYALCTNVMTHPDYVGKGLFVEIGKEALEYVKLLGIKFCFGVPNEKAVKGHLKVGWSAANEIQFYQKVFLDKTKVNENRDIIPGYVQQLSDSDLFSLYTAKYDFYFMRSSSWIKWRYNKPHSNYINFGINNGNDKGFVILKEYTDPKTAMRKLHIVDFGYANLNSFDKLLDHCCFIASTKDFGILNMWHYSFNEEETKLLTSKEFVRTDERNLVIVHTLGNKINLPEKNWHVTLYDNDVY